MILNGLINGSESGEGIAEARLKCKDGNFIWVESRGKTFIDRNGEKKILINIRNIAQRKKAEQRLKESEFKYRTLFEETMTPIFIIDENSMYVDANKAALDFVECGIDEIRKLNVFDFAPPHFLEKQRREHSPFYDRRTLETEYYINGKIKTLLLNIVPLEIEGKKNLLGVGSDITARKKAEETIEKFAFLVQNSNDFIVMASMDQKMIFLNKAGKSLVGLEPNSDVTSLTIHELLPEEDRIRLESITLPALLEKGYWSGEGTLSYFPTGESIPVLINSFLINDSQGNPIGIGTVQHNITELKKAEAKAIQEMEKSDLYLNLVEVIIVALDRDGKITMLNKKGCSLLEYEEGELISKNWFETCLPPHDRKRVSEYFKKLMNGELEVIQFYREFCLY